MATLLKANGNHEPITEPLTLETMQRLVGGFIEFVTLARVHSGRLILIVDEEGRLKGKPANAMATVLYGGTPPSHDHIIVGDTILCICLDEGQDTERFL